MLEGVAVAPGAGPLTPPLGLPSPFGVSQASVLSAPRATAATLMDWYGPGVLAHILLHPTGRMGKVHFCSVFIMATHTLVCLGGLLIAWVRVHAGTWDTQGNGDLKARFRANATHMSKTSLQLLLVIAAFLGKSLNLNNSGFFFYSTTLEPPK